MRNKALNFILNLIFILLLLVVSLAAMFMYSLIKITEPSKKLVSFLSHVHEENYINAYIYLSTDLIDYIHSDCSIPESGNYDPKEFCLEKYIKQNQLNKIIIEKVKIFGFTEIIPWNNQVNLGETASFKVESSEVIKEIKFVLIKNQSNEWVINEILFEN